jgi:hypothetical protein
MTIRFVTTSHLEGFSLYGRGLLDNWHRMPATLDWYAEGYDVPAAERVTQKDCGALSELSAFKARHAKYRPPYYLWDVVRFSHKVFAMHDALRDHDGIGGWIDADVMLLQDVPGDWLRSLLPDGHYAAMFRRKGTHSELGFWLVDCSHPAHKAVFDAALAMYTSDTFKFLEGWTDCHVFDAVLRRFEADGRVKVANLTTEDCDHPMAARKDFAAYFDHRKGPERKKLGYSPERQAA